MRFLIDAQLPPALADWLNDAGHAAEHVLDVGLAGADDQEIWLDAVAKDAVLITKDEDFLAVRARSPGGPAVIWLRIGNATNRRLLTWFAVRFPSILASVEAGDGIIEVR